MEDSTLRIIEGAAEFLWSEEIQNSLDTFATNHAPMFSDCTSAQDEQRLEWGEAHKDFQALVELHLERFLGTQSISAEEFVQACQDALDHGSWANCRGVVEVVLSMTTYEHFLQMMIAAAERKQKSTSYSVQGPPPRLLPLAHAVRARSLLA
jgi:NAD/NADP transhydrogenase alpha subunit